MNGSLLDPLWERGVHAYFKATNLARLDNELIDTALSLLHLDYARPAVRDPPPSDGGRSRPRLPTGRAAFSERSMPYVLNAVTASREPSAWTARTREWARAVIEAASNASTGRAYVNFLGDAGAATTAYGKETYARLVALKNEYDPTNVFRRNQNIEPRPAV